MGSKMKPMCNSVALWAPAARGTSRGLAPPAPAGLMGRCPHGTQAVAPRSQHKLLAAYLAQEGSAVFGSTGPRGPKGRYFGGGTCTTHHTLAGVSEGKITFIFDFDPFLSLRLLLFWGAGFRLGKRKNSNDPRQN